MPKKLTVIVPIYNEQELIGGCLDALLLQTLEHDLYEVIVIDNNSTDDSLGVIEEFLVNNHLQYRFAGPAEEPGVIPPGEILIVKSPRNGGYSYGNNLGIRMARVMKMFRYLLIINNDLVLKADFLEEMVNRFEDLHERCHTDRIALGATELGEDGRVHHNGFHYLHILSGITFASPFFPSFKYIVGSSIFTGIDAPLMDESFFLYFDDTQYSKILRRNGYILESSPGSIFIHEVGGTANKGLQGQIFKGLRRFYFLNYPFLLPVVVPLRLILIIWLRITTRDWHFN